MSRDVARVLDILLAAKTILRFVAGLTPEIFASDELRQSAVLYQFTVLGEAARRVSEDYRSAHPTVNWAGIVGFRNRIIHEYADVDLDIVWQIAHEDLPRAIEALEPLVPKELDDQNG